MEMWESVHVFLRKRYESRGLDLVVATDTPAMRFLERYGPDAFPGVPVVFSASRIAPARQLSDHAKVTGIVESLDARGTIELIRTLEPGTRRIICINTDTMHGDELRALVEEALSSMQEPPEFEWLVSLTVEETVKRLADASPDSAVLFLSYLDPTKQRVTLDQTLGVFARECPRPIYTLYDAYLGYGVIGGRVVSAEAYGEAAAAMAVRILNGESASGIPIIGAGVNPLLLDDRALNRFNIRRDLIPTDARILFAKDSFLHQNARAIAAIVAVIVFQGLIIAGLLISRRRAKAAEQALREGDLRFSALADNIPGIVYRALNLPNGSRRLEYTSSGVERILGPTLARTVRENFDHYFTLMSPEDFDRIQSEADRCLRASDAFSCLYRVRTESGELRWIHSIASHRTLADGSVQWDGILLDVTSEQQAHQALIASETRFRALGENLPGIPFTTLRTPDGRRIAEYLGPRLEHYLGAEAAAEVRRDLTRFFDLIHPDDQPAVRAERIAALEQRRNFDCEYRIRNADGAYRWMRSAATPITLPDSSIRWHGVLLDIDEAKRSQKSLIRRDAILHAVAEAGRLLAQAEQPQDVMQQVLSLLGGAAEADRAYLFRRAEDPTLGMVNHMDSEWCSTGVPSQIDDPRFSILPDSQWDHDRWLAPLSRGETIVRQVSDIASPEREYFESQSLKTLALVPVGIVGRWWGFLGFDACRAPADWSAVEVDALRTAANAIAASLERDVRETHLHQQDEALRRIAENIPGFVYRLTMSPDEIIRLEYITKGFSEIFDSEPMWIPHPLNDHNNRQAPEDRPRIADAMRRCAATLEPLDIITRVIRPRGDSRWIHLRATVSRRERDTVFDGVVMDVTDRRAAEELFRRSEERYRLASRAGGDVIWDWDFESGFLTWNETLGRIAGYFPAEGRTPIEWWTERVHPEDRERVAKGIYAVINGEGTGWADEYRFRHAGGHFLEITDRGYVVRDHTGKALRMVGVMVDRTSAKQAERVLRESENRYRGLVENLPVGVCLHDGERFAYVNESMRSLLGAPTSESLIGCSLRDILSPDERPTLEARCSEVIESNLAAPPMEQTFIRLDGTPVAVEIRCTPIHHEGRRLIHTTAVDLTARKQAEESFRRTADVQQLLLSELDHRVKNSLAGLLTLIDLTQTGTPSLPQFAASIRARVQGMVSVHSLLSDGHWAPVPLKRLITSLIPPGHPGAVEVGGPPVDVPARQVTALAMIVQELFTNCVKHGAMRLKEGNVRITWTIEPGMDATPTQTVRIRWTESGVSPIELPITPSVGTRLIEGFCRFELGGSVTLNFTAEGVDHLVQVTLDPRGIGEQKPGAELFRTGRPDTEEPSGAQAEAGARA